MKNSKQLLQTRDAYMRPVAEAAADAGDADTLGAVQRLFDPAYVRVAALIDELDAIDRDPGLMEFRRAEKRKALGDQFDALTAELMPQLDAPDAKIQAEIDGLMHAADQGMEREPGGSGWLRKQKAAPDAAQNVRVAEARGVWRPLDARTFSAMYREWVLTDDPRARMAEDDPAGALVSPRDREWARQHRLAANPALAARVNVLRAQLRSHALLRETLQMVLREGAAEVAHAR